MHKYSTNHRRGSGRERGERADRIHSQQCHGECGFRVDVNCRICHFAFVLYRFLIMLCCLHSTIFDDACDTRTKQQESVEREGEGGDVTIKTRPIVLGVKVNNTNLLHPDSVKGKG